MVVIFYVNDIFGPWNSSNERIGFIKL